MHDYITEQKALLPFTTAPSKPSQETRTFLSRRRDLIEPCTLALIHFLAASQCLILYGIHRLPWVSPTSALCSFFADLAVSLRLSIPSSLGTAILFFIAAPYLARPERLVTTWYLIMLCYFAGSTSGALLLMWIWE